jgi:two-component system, LytTR family, response regulator
MGEPGSTSGDLRLVRIEARTRSADERGSVAVVDLPGGESGSKIILRTRRRVIVLNEKDVEWIDAAGNYIRFHAGPAQHKVRGTLKDIEQLLPGARFVRVHRSTIVNIESVREFVRTPYGDLIAVLNHGQRLAVGRLFRGNVEAVLDTRL